MTTMSIQLPESLHNGIEDIAREEGIVWVDKAILKRHMNRLLNTLSVQREPVDIELLQQEMRAASLSPNEFSQSIIQEREE